MITPSFKYCYCLQHFVLLLSSALNLRPLDAQSYLYKIKVQVK